jgi:hypothetical protein
MRLIRFLLSYVTVSVAGIVMVAFLALNHYKVQLDVFGPEYSVSLAIVIGGALLLGFVLALLLLLPGHIATTVHAWSLNREVRLLEDEVAEGDERYTRWLSQHEHLLAGHERMLHRHQMLVAEYSRVAAERDQAYLQLASTTQAQPTLSPPAQSAVAGRAGRLLPPVAPDPRPELLPDLPEYDDQVVIPVEFEEPHVEQPTVPSERRRIRAEVAKPRRVMAAPASALRATATGLEPATVVSSTDPAPTLTGSLERAVPATDPPASRAFTPPSPRNSRAETSQAQPAVAVRVRQMRERMAAFRDGLDQRVAALRDTAESQLERLKQR